MSSDRGFYAEIGTPVPLAHQRLRPLVLPWWLE